MTASALRGGEKPFGLTLILRFFDRCGNSGFPSSATGGGNPQFPLGRGGYKELPQSRRLRETRRASSLREGANKVG